MILPKNLLIEALAAARAIADKGARAQALVALAPHLPEADRPAVAAEALATAGALGYDHDCLTHESKEIRAEVLTALAPHLPEDLLPEALAVAARTIAMGGGYSQALDLSAQRC